MFLTEPTNLDGAVILLQLAHREATECDRLFRDVFSDEYSEPNDPHVAQAFSEQRIAWENYKHAETLVESFQGQFSYFIDMDKNTMTILVADLHGTELLTYDF